MMQSAIPNITLLTSAPEPVEPGLAKLKMVILFFFLALFLGVVIWVMFKKPGSYEDTSRIPLDDQEIMTPRDSS